MRLREMHVNGVSALARPRRIGGSGETEIYCFLSPSARYGIYITRTEVPNFRPLETHFYNYHFTVSDFILDTVTEYTSACNSFKRFHRFYFLNDSLGVLVDFSRNSGTVTQNVVRFSHDNLSVTCEYARIWNFNVDDMLFETDNTHLISTTALMKYGNIAYLPILGEKDHISKIYFRLVPANPFQLWISEAPLLTFSEQEAYQQAVQNGVAEQLQLSNLCIDKRCYPLINETSLYFILRLRSEPGGFQVYPPTCVAMLTVDFINYFERNFSMAAQITATVSQLLWTASPGKFYVRPRFVKILAQSGPVAIIRAFICAPERSWILVNLETMTLSPLDYQKLAKHNCAMLDRNRLIFQRQQNLKIVSYNVIWAYYSVPRLKHLAFWKAVIGLKRYFSKECWQFHVMSENKFCTICWTLKCISQLLPCCCSFDS